MVTPQLYKISQLYSPVAWSSGPRKWTQAGRPQGLSGSPRTNLEDLRGPGLTSFRCSQHAVEAFVQIRGLFSPSLVSMSEWMDGWMDASEGNGRVFQTGSFIDRILRL